MNSRYSIGRWYILFCAGVLFWVACPYLIKWEIDVSSGKVVEGSLTLGKTALSDEGTATILAETYPASALLVAELSMEVPSRVLAYKHRWTTDIVKAPFTHSFSFKSHHGGSTWNAQATFNVDSALDPKSNTKIHVRRTFLGSKSPRPVTAGVTLDAPPEHEISGATFTLYAVDLTVSEFVLRLALVSIVLAPLFILLGLGMYVRNTLRSRTLSGVSGL